MEKDPQVKQSDSDGEDELFETPSDQTTTLAIVHQPPTDSAVTTSDVNAIQQIKTLTVAESNKPALRSRSKLPVQRGYTQTAEIEYLITLQFK